VQPGVGHFVDGSVWKVVQGFVNSFVRFYGDFLLERVCFVENFSLLIILIYFE